MEQEQSATKLKEAVDAATSAGEAALKVASARFEEEKLERQIQVGCGVGTPRLIPPLALILALSISLAQAQASASAQAKSPRR